MSLANQEQQALDFIHKYHEEQGVIPTHVAIADGIGIKHRQQVTAIIKILIEKGELINTTRFGLYNIK